MEIYSDITGSMAASDSNLLPAADKLLTETNYMVILHYKLIDDVI